MNRRHFTALAALLLSLLVVGLWTNSARSQYPFRKVAVPKLPEALAAAAEMKEEDAIKMLNALGPTVQQQLAAGKEVALPGLGLFRVVRIPAHRDLNGGRPVLVPGRNFVEFLPDANLIRASNAREAKPAEVVEPFQYNPLRNQVKSPTVGRVRTPSTRVP